MSRTQAFATYLPSIGLLLLLVAVIATRRMDAAVFTADPAAYLNVHPLTGLLSNLGVLLWCASASICLFAALVAARSGKREYVGFLLASSALTFYLLFDDLFMFHEELAERYLGIGQTTVVGALGLCVLAYLVSYRHMIVATDYSALMAAFVLLSMSVLFDQLQDVLGLQLSHWAYLTEDGLKWLGIASWCSYFVQTSYRCINTVSDATEATDPTEWAHR